MEFLMGITILFLIFIIALSLARITELENVLKKHKIKEPAREFVSDYDFD